jgi:cytoskeleton protein RodZ
MPSATPSLGSYLRGLRDERRGSLEEMAHATRLSVRQLTALEADNFAELPPPVFVKGFIRAYCHHLGVAADEALARYRDIRGEPPASTRATPSVPRAPSWSTSPTFISLLLLIVFGASLLALNLGGARGPKPSAAPVMPAATVEPATPPGAPTLVAPPPAATPAAARPGGVTVQRLTVKVIEPTWIRVQIDDGHSVEELLPVGATRQWTAAKRFVLTVGNAGGVALTLNGRPVAPLGSRGAVIRGLELPQARTATGK